MAAPDNDFGTVGVAPGVRLWAGQVIGAAHDDGSQARREISDADWKTFGQEADGRLRQWAEADFVPGDLGGF